jgi:predicted transposase YdaD
LLLGLKFEKNFTNQLLRGVHDVMTESSTYQAILEEGEKRGEERGEKRGEKRGKSEGLKVGQLQAMRKTLLSQGEKKFGEPTDAIRVRIEKIASIRRLDELLLRILEAKNWDELFGA